MTAAIAAGALYFAVVFAAGFVLGGVRIGLLAPAVGDVAATLIELPVILALSWAACLLILRRLRVASRAGARILMGAVAFTLLIAAEIALGLGLMNRTFTAQMREMATAPALIGLAGQILFAFFPLLALKVRRTE
jgi:amino acid transporter